MFPVIGSFHGPRGMFEVGNVILEPMPYLHNHEDKEEDQCEDNGDQGGKLKFHKENVDR